VDDPYKLRQRRRQFPYYLVDPLARVPGIDETRNVVFQKEVYWGMKNRRSTLIRLFVMLLLFMVPVSFGGGDVLLRTQITLCVLAAPALLVNTCIKERRQGNLDMLRLTPLKAREIVLGKMRAAAWLLSPIVMSGFVGTVIVVFGRWSLTMDIGFVVLQCSLLAAVCWFCLAVSMVSSIISSRAATAFVFSYFVCLSLVFAFSLYAASAPGSFRDHSYFGLVGLVLVVTILSVACAAFYITRLAIYLFERRYLQGT
jgi:ABC-type transport system involved in multi-copper enzyme maturation permease subunit